MKFKEIISIESIYDKLGYEVGSLQDSMKHRFWSPLKNDKIR